MGHFHANGPDGWRMEGAARGRCRQRFFREMRSGERRDANGRAVSGTAAAVPHFVESLQKMDSGRGENFRA